MNFKLFDFLGPNLGFTYDEGLRFQTKFGGFLSFVFVVLSIVIVGTMSVSFFDRTSPTIIQETVKYSSAPRINFTDRFRISIRMTIGNETVYKGLDKIQIELTLNYVYKSNYRNLSTTKLPLFICKQEDFPNHQQYYNQYKLNESLCPDLKDLYVKGDFLSDEMYFFQIKFHMCQNSPITGKSDTGDDIVCKSDKEIKQFLTNNLVKAHLFFTDSFYEDKNYTNPVINYIDNYNLNLYFDTQRETHFYLQNSVLFSDDTYFFLFQKNRLFSNIAYSQVSERAAARESNMYDFGLINIRASKSSLNITRTYRGFADLAANIGAILNLVMFMFNCSVFLFSSLEYYIKILRPSMYIYQKSIKLDMAKINRIELENKKNILTPTIKTETGKILFDESKTRININNASKININSVKDIRDGISVENFNINLRKCSNLDTKFEHLNYSTNNTEKAEKKYEKIGILKFNHEKNFLQKLLICFCPCFIICCKKLKKDVEVLEYSKKFYYKYSDFFNFFEKFYEMNLVIKLIMKKEEKEMVDLIKTLIFIKKDDILTHVKNNCQKIKLVKNDAGDDLKVKASITDHELRLKRYLSKIAIKEERSIFEDNFIQIFDKINMQDL